MTNTNRTVVEEVLKATLDTLKKEIEKEPLSPERVSALTKVIETLSATNLHIRL